MTLLRTLVYICTVDPAHSLINIVSKTWLEVVFWTLAVQFTRYDEHAFCVFVEKFEKLTNKSSFRMDVAVFPRTFIVLCQATYISTCRFHRFEKN